MDLSFKSQLVSCILLTFYGIVKSYLLYRNISYFSVKNTKLTRPSDMFYLDAISRCKKLLKQKKKYYRKHYKQTPIF